MAYTKEQLDSLIALRASGQLRVQLGDKLVHYQTGADLDTAIEQAKRDVATAADAAAGRATVTRKYATYSRG
jgi:hypothetical protein